MIHLLDTENEITFDGTAGSDEKGAIQLILQRAASFVTAQFFEEPTSDEERMHVRACVDSQQSTPSPFLVARVELGDDGGR